MQTAALRYQLPKKAIKTDCPDCGHRHRRTLSRYVDTRTNEPLPEQYGRCDRESNCGYHISPYHKSPSGISYADEVYTQWKDENPATSLASKINQPLSHQRTGQRGVCQHVRTASSAQTHLHPISQLPLTGATPVASPVYAIPEVVFQQSVGHYDRNQFALLLRQHLGVSVADDLLQRFQVGTSSRWPGACVFWYIDENGRKRGGQIKLFDQTFHTVKYIDRQGEKRSKTDWVHSALAYRLDQQQQPRPTWLTNYIEHADRSPCLFGLSQLRTAPVDQPVAIVEAPKTAVLCTAYYPQFVWLAVGGKSYLKAERLTPVSGRKIVLFPDLNAYYDLVNEKGQVNKGWLTRADELRQQGFTVKVSDYLENRATDEHKAAGLDLADYLLEEWKGCPPDWDTAAAGRAKQCNGTGLCGTTPIFPPTTRTAFPTSPLAWDTAQQLRRIRWCVLPPGVEELPE